MPLTKNIRGADDVDLGRNREEHVEEVVHPTGVIEAHVTTNLAGYVTTFL